MTWHKKRNRCNRRPVVWQTAAVLAFVTLAEARGQALLPPIKDPKPGISYHIQAFLSGWSLHVQGFAAKDDADICQGPFDAKQVWQIVPSDKHRGWFHIRTQLPATKGQDSFRFLNVFRNNKDIGGRLCLGNQEPDQVWRFVPAGQAGWYYHIESKVSELTLDVTEGSQAPGVRVGQAHSHPLQVWGFVPDRGEKRLLIVAPQAWQKTLAAFVEHKKKLLPTELVALDDIIKGTTGVDHAEKLKRYLHERWKIGGIGYVLLVGDAEVIPTRFIFLTNVAAGPQRNTVWTAYHPSDLYYSDLAKRDGSFDDWNANKEGINAQHYGQLMGYDGKDPVNVDQVDYLPDVALGRWPVHTIPQLRAVIAKTIRYENHVLADDLPTIRRAAFINGPNFSDLRQKMDAWGQKLEAVSMWRPVRRYAKYEGGDDQIPTPYDDAVGKVLDHGVGMIFHVGHGSDTCWDSCLDIDRLKSLKDANLPPVMFSIGCGTASFAPAAPYQRYVDIHGKQHEAIDGNDSMAAPPPPNNYQRGKFGGV